MNLIQDCQVASLANVGSNYLVAGIEAKRLGTKHPSIVPYQMFNTKNGHLVICAGNDSQYHKLCQKLGCKELENPEYRTNQLRVQNRNQLISLLSNIFVQKSTQEWVRILENDGVPFAPVNNLKQTFDHPQVIHRDIVKTVDHPTAGKIKLVGPPIKYSSTKAEIYRAPPLLGQHTREILLELGYTDKQIKEMEKDNIFF